MNPLHSLVTQYLGRLKRLRNCCTRIDDLVEKGQLAVTDCDQVYEATFLAATALFEHFLEESLICVVCSRHPKMGRGILLKPRTREHFQRLLFANRDYVDLLPYKRTIQLAELYLDEGRPFSSIPEDRRGLLTEAVTIRHAIAHRSQKAITEFRCKITGVDSLPPHRQFPGPFLRSVFRHGPRQTRHELYFWVYESSADIIRKSWLQ